ncbi:glycosyltransferase family 4 protein [Halobium salinum]|uniref:Glycosyltransferase family 4 protein n=1 Tax=Halobium salinum TaxID=1364940 RepID=A0ABD5PAH5_9EURY|nr:glycosyltransferase family 4 protein [Halobium salinum]
MVWNIALETARQGCEVTIVERQWDGLPRVEKRDSVTFRRVSLATGSDDPWAEVPYRMVSTPTGAARLIVDRTNFALKAYGVLRNLEFDVIHVHLPFAANVLVTVAPTLRKRMIYTAHIGETEKRVDDPPFSPDVYLAKRVALSAILNDDALNSFKNRGVNPKRLSFVPNGVDVERFSQSDASRRGEVERKYGLSDRTVVLFVGSVTPRKGAAELLNAFINVHTEFPDAKLVFAGTTDLSPEYVARIRSVADEAGLDERVVFTGYTSEEEIQGLYERADLFALPSHDDGFPLVVTEAMAAGTPIIASNVGGIPRQVEDGVQGCLVEPKNSAELIDALKTVLGDEERRERMSVGARRRAEEFAWDRIASRYISIYETVAEAVERAG